MFDSLRNYAEEKYKQDFRWDEVIAGEIEVQEVPGDHYTILKDPNVKVLAERLKECLHKAGDGQGKSGPKGSSYFIKKNY